VKKGGRKERRKGGKEGRREGEKERRRVGEELILSLFPLSLLSHFPSFPAFPPSLFLSYRPRQRPYRGVDIYASNEDALRTPAVAVTYHTRRCQKHRIPAIGDSVRPDQSSLLSLSYLSLASV